jgi:methylated-DNA-protein-cysteine methyltransferase-like protein
LDKKINQGEGWHKMTTNLKEAGLRERIYAVTNQIPTGQVSTYGQIAAIVGPGCNAREVGYAMAALSANDLTTPWHRVINAQGGISPRGGDGPAVQQTFLEHEGVEFDAQGHVDLDQYGWLGPDWEWLDTHGFYPAPSLKSAKKKAEGQQLSLFD